MSDPRDAYVRPVKFFDVSPTAEERRPYLPSRMSPAQLAASHELELAQYRLIAWTHHELPQRLRALDADLVLAQAEIASFQRQQAEFRRFNVWSGGGNPHFLAEEDTSLALLAAQQRLALLQADRGQVLQQQDFEFRQRQMEVERAVLNFRGR